jgi:phosphomannomutase
MLGILSLMAGRNARLSELVGSFPRYSILKGTVPLRTQRIPALLMMLRDRYEAESGVANIADGLRMTWPDRWFHVRVSQTEPIVRVICEQRGDPPNALYESLLDEVRRFA